MTTKLALYNAALREHGNRRLASLTEAKEGRYVLDDVYDIALRYCLEQGAWNFAIRSQELASDDAVDPAFGYAYAFLKPDDWIRTVGLSASDYFNPPVTQYVDENGYLWCDLDPLYIRYVSSDAEFGYDLGKWPATFERAVSLYLAYLIAPTITNSTGDKDAIYKEFRRALTDARSKDAMNDPVAFPPQGSWVSARVGGYPYSSYKRA